MEPWKHAFRERIYSKLRIEPNIVILAALIGRSDGQWEVVALSEAMIDRKEQPLLLGPFADIEQRQVVIEAAFPGATSRTTHLWIPREMETYLKNAGYTEILPIPLT